MKIKTCFLILFFTCLIFNFSFSQEIEIKQAEKDGMKPYVENFTSFSIPRESSSYTNEWIKHNLGKYRNHPDFGKDPANPIYKDYIEVLEKRKENERFFVNASRPEKFILEKAYGPINFFKNGEWITINHKISEKGNGIYESSDQIVPVGINTKLFNTYLKTPSGKIDFNNWKLYGRRSGDINVLLAEANWLDYTIGDDGIYIKNIFPGIDAKMYSLGGSVKTNFIIKKCNYSGFDYLMFKDEFQSLVKGDFEFKSATSKNHAVSELNFKFGNQTVLEVHEAICYPLNGGPRDSEKIIAEYFIDGNSMEIAVPVEWIKKLISYTDVVIDPLVSSSATLPQASILGTNRASWPQYSCVVTNPSCNYNLNVTTPPNATITDVQFTFAYLASLANGCWMSDGATRISTGTCMAPSLATNYYYCNVTNSGTCTATNLSIWSHVGSCMPPPSCFGTVVPFTLRFYRDCYGPTTLCSGSCIGANSPWTMTIFGQTLAYTNTVTPFTLSSTNVCTNQTVTANAPAQYGVPPYTWSWSSNPANISSSVQNPTFSFTSPGTYTVSCTVTDACGNAVVSTKTITVTGPTITATPNSFTICQNSSAALSVLGASTYTWSTATGLNNVNSSTPLANPLSTTIYTVIGTTAGCNSAPKTVTVNVSPLPVATPASNSPICLGGTLNLTSSVATSYTWTGPNGFSSNISKFDSKWCIELYMESGFDNRFSSNDITECNYYLYCNRS